MALTPLDWIVVGIYGAIVLAIGFGLARRAGGSVEDYFVAGRSLPWWLAGTSIAATWFATDAPLATAALVRRQGVYGNWLWWYEAAGILMLTFFYARLWRRAGVLTDAELIEIRYGGAPARALRCFSAVYQGLLKNAVVMGWVMLAMVKFSRVLLGWDPALTLAVCVGLALAYTVASGLWGVVVTDLLQFVAGMLGAVTLAGIVLTRFGGPSGMAEAIRAVPGAPPGALDLVPSPAHASSLETVSFLCLILILWLRSGQGDGYVAQRLFATRDERQAVKAVAVVRVRGDGPPHVAVDRGGAGVAARVSARGDGSGVGRGPRTRVSDDDPRTHAGWAAGADGRHLPRRLHEHDGHAPVLGGVVHGERRVSTLPASGSLRTALRRGVAGGGRAAGGGGGRRGVADGFDSAGLDLHHRAHGGGCIRMAPALVLVAGERVGGDRRHGGVGAPGQRAADRGRARAGPGPPR